MITAESQIKIDQLFDLHAWGICKSWFPDWLKSWQPLCKHASPWLVTRPALSLDPGQLLKITSKGLHPEVQRAALVQNGNGSAVDIPFTSMRLATRFVCYRVCLLWGSCLERNHYWLGNLTNPSERALCYLWCKLKIQLFGWRQSMFSAENNQTFTPREEGW